MPFFRNNNDDDKLTGFKRKLEDPNNPYEPYLKHQKIDEWATFFLRKDFEEKLAATIQNVCQAFGSCEVKVKEDSSLFATQYEWKIKIKFNIGKKNEADTETNLFRDFFGHLDKSFFGHLDKKLISAEYVEMDLVKKMVVTMLVKEDKINNFTWSFKHLVSLFSKDREQFYSFIKSTLQLDKQQINKATNWDNSDKHESPSSEDSSHEEGRRRT